MIQSKQCRVNTPQWKLNVSISSEPEQGSELVGTIREKLVELQWPDNDIFKIHLALEEVVMNAIKHGNKLDPQKNISVVCTIEPELFTADIADQGEGFVRQDVPDPTREENLYRESGRGLTIVENFMTSVEYIGCGNLVKMRKKKSSP